MRAKETKRWLTSVANHRKMPEMRLVRWRTRESMLALCVSAPAGMEMEAWRTLE